MPKFGRQSITNLTQSERDLQTLHREAIKIIDYSIIFGYRTPEQQNALFKKGRKLIPGAKGDKRAHYIITKIAEVVTYRGFEKKSNHNYWPSKATDQVPYPSAWSRPEKIYELAGVLKAVYYRLKAEGKITSTMRFGSDWKNPPDPAHIEIVE